MLLFMKVNDPKIQRRYYFKRFSCRNAEIILKSISYGHIATVNWSHYFPSYQILLLTRNIIDKSIETPVPKKNHENKHQTNYKIIYLSIKLLICFCVLECILYQLCYKSENSKINFFIKKIFLVSAYEHIYIYIYIYMWIIK